MMKKLKHYYDLLLGEKVTKILGIIGYFVGIFLVIYILVFLVGLALKLQGWF